MESVEGAASAERVEERAAKEEADARAAAESEEVRQCLLSQYAEFSFTVCDESGGKAARSWMKATSLARVATQPDACVGVMDRTDTAMDVAMEVEPSVTPLLRLGSRSPHLAVMREKRLF